MIDIIRDGLSIRYIAMLSRIDEGILNDYVDFKSLSRLNGYKLKDQKFSIDDSRNIIKSVQLNKNLQILKKKFAFYNFKGGVGKTNICFQLSSHIALMGYNFLVIDAAPQAHLSISFGFQSDSFSLTLCDLLTKKASFNDIKKSIFLGFDLIPSNLSLTRIESIFYKDNQSFGKLSEQLLFVENDYDFIFLDTNSTISFLNRNIVFFSDVINLFCKTQPYSLNGLKILLEDLNNFYTHVAVSPKKEISEAMEKIAKPGIGTSSRHSIGLDKSLGEFYFLNIDLIIPFKNQARKSFDKEDLFRLADSIKTHGVCQPLTVIKESNDKYEVLSGERRLRAAKLVGLTKVPCIILKEGSHANSIALIENIHRNDLTPIELGMAFKRLLEFSVFESQEHLARSISISKGTVSEYISFSELPEEIKNKLIEHNITSRSRLRSIAKSLKKNDIQKVNKIISGCSDQNKVLILQFFMFGNKIKVKYKWLKNIDDLVKNKLKSVLQNFIDAL